MDSVKDKLGLGGGAPASGENRDDFPEPDDYKNSKSQKGRVVGVQADMNEQPINTKHETEYGFAEWVASGKLTGKKTIVTGGDSGIGLAAAIMFAMEGADVAIVYLPEEEKDAQWAKGRIEKTGQKCLLLPTDIRDEVQVNSMISAVMEQFGAIDVLVNNASVMYDQKTLDEVEPEQFDRTVKTNVYGTYYVTRAALKYMKEGGSIIVTASQVAYAGPPTLIDYSTTKAAQIGFVRSLSQNLLSRKIRVNAVCPGPVWTPLQEAAMDQKTLEEWHQSPAPMGRIGQPSELGPAYLFLASNMMSSFITGQSIHVNGGAIVNG